MGSAGACGRVIVYNVKYKPLKDKRMLNGNYKGRRVCDIDRIENIGPHSIPFYKHRYNGVKCDVPKHITRIDSKICPGWQFRFSRLDLPKKSAYISDSQGGGQMASLEALIAYMRLVLNETPNVRRNVERRFTLLEGSKLRVLS